MTPISIYSFLLSRLGGIHKEEDYICICGISDRVKRKKITEDYMTTAEVLQRLGEWRRLNNTQYSLYYTPATLTAGICDRHDTRATSTACIWADYDGETEATKSFEQENSWGNVPVPNIMVATSQGHWQCLWQLNKPELDMSIVKDVVSRLAYYSGGDTSVSNPARILRLPDFKNMKTGRKSWNVQAYRVHDRKFSLNDFSPLPPAPQSKKTLKVPKTEQHKPPVLGCDPVDIDVSACPLMSAMTSWTRAQWLSVGLALQIRCGDSGVARWLLMSAEDHVKYRGQADCIQQLTAAAGLWPYRCGKLGYRCDGCNGLLDYVWRATRR